jgi:ATP-dependent Clp protease ATP-binding subunit ClpC
MNVHMAVLRLLCWTTSDRTRPPMHDKGRFAMFTERAHPSASKTPTLDQMGIDLTARARQGEMTPVIGRDKDIERVIQVLSRNPMSHTGIRKNNAALISDWVSEPVRGMRKMAILEGVAQLMSSFRAPAMASGAEAQELSWLSHCLEKLQGKRLVTLDVGLLGAGATSLSEFEARFNKIIEEIRASPDCIIFIDEPHALVAFAQSAYGAAKGRVDVAPVRDPALAHGDIQCIGAVTLDEYRMYIEQDPALQRHFQEVIVHEMVAAEEIVPHQRGDNASTQEQG